MKRFLVSGDTDAVAPRAALRGVDCHQHIWPEALLEALRQRQSPPRIANGQLYLEGESPFTLNLADHDIARRRRVDEADGIGLTLLSLSSPLGIENLPPDEAWGLTGIWNGWADLLAEESASTHRIWAAPQLKEPDLAGLAATLANPMICGLQVPATSLATPHDLDELIPTLAVAESAGLPVLVHPGPAVLPPGQPSGSSLPNWWPALTSYPAQQAAAWFTWLCAGRTSLPTLRIAFVALAGLAPLHHERLRQRGGELGVIDNEVYYETSSYGRSAVDAMVRVTGTDQLIHGSDRPYALPTDPELGPAFSHALFKVNPERFLDGGSR